MQIITQFKTGKLSFFFDLLLQFILVDYLLKISQSFCGVIKHLVLFDTFTDDLIEDDLETNRDATSLQVRIVIFSDLLYFGVLLLGTFLDT